MLTAHPRFGVALGGLLVPVLSLGCQDHQPETVAAQLSADCCTAACFPDGMLGHECTFQGLRARLSKLAKEKDLHLGRVHCAAINEPCNTTCETPPGRRLSCSGDVMR
jgi:hypothetical protein